MTKLIKTFESFTFGDDSIEMPHAAPRPDMTQGPAIDHDAHHEVENYMMFGNLETIKRLVTELLEMPPHKIDAVLKDGHSWAVDHIATSKDDIEEVFNFIKNEMTEDIQEGTSYSCNECGASYESVAEGDSCSSCGGTLSQKA